MVVIREFIPYEKQNIIKYVEEKKAEMEKLRPKSVVQRPDTWNESDHRLLKKYIDGGSTAETIEKFFRQTAEHFREAEIIGSQINSLNKAVRNLNNYRGHQILHNRVRDFSLDEPPEGKEVTKTIDEDDSDWVARWRADTRTSSRVRYNSPASVAATDEYNVHGRTRSNADSIKPKESFSSFASRKKKLIPDCPASVRKILDKAKNRRRSEAPKNDVPVSIVELKLY